MLCITKENDNMFSLWENKRERDIYAILKKKIGLRDGIIEHVF